MKKDSNTDQKIEEIIEQKVEQRVQEELEKRGIEKAESDEQEESNKKEVTRRSFLKKLGAGAIGISALSLSPASALNIRSNDFSVYAGNDSTKELQVNSGGPVEVKNSDLDLTGGNLDNTTFIDFGDRDDDGYYWRQGVLSDDEWFLQWRNDNGDNKIPLRIPMSSNYIRIDENIRLQTGQSLEDDSGNSRLEFNSSTATQVRDGAGNLAAQYKDSNHIKFFPRSGQPFIINDQNGEFNAVKYTTDSTKGTLELTKANLDMRNNNIKNVEKTTFNNSGNDFWRINDGSGGSNTSPHTARFDDRDMRFYSGTGIGTVWRLNQDGSVEYPEGPVTINGDQVATRKWTKNNADVPNADYADSAGDADTVDGSNVFVQSSQPSNPSNGDIWVDTS
ncbi:twin-arginine translocation signal domain-containing protein [Candidatus Nanohalobium constans]|uniref:Twin-arginine translocation signal domain-containing protein n=1 Tax=Candidatus Nanohalobium constans TaxID=2565781 RepID=A0A5Q0UFI1_9ARCH|nr:twin-arginine translocation signal domain-containing protein [Candidatus Nanohalobium constans]QGA80336.1 hypothetical protein LC1Nh_0435 [Candidatus Nanohalobium constans]